MYIANYRCTVRVDTLAVNRRWKSFITTVSSCSWNTVIIIGSSGGVGGGGGGGGSGGGGGVSGGITGGCGCCSTVAQKCMTLPVSVTCIVLIRRIYRHVDVLYHCCKRLILEYVGIFSK